MFTGLEAEQGCTKEEGNYPREGLEKNGGGPLRILMVKKTKRNEKQKDLKDGVTIPEIRTLRWAIPQEHGKVTSPSRNKKKAEMT